MSLSSNFSRLFFSWRVLGVVAAASWCAGAAAGEIDLTNFSPSLGYEISGFKPNSVPTQMVSGLGDFNGDGLSDILIGSPLDNCAYVVFGSATNSGSLDLQSFAADNSRGFRISAGMNDGAVGMEVSGAGDVNGDGYRDVLLGTWSGMAYLVFGAAGDTSNLNLDTAGTNPRVIRFTKTGVSSFGSWVSAAGDFNGDGYGDFVVSAITEDPQPGTYGRQVDYLLPGRAAWAGNVDLGGFVSGDQAGIRIFSSYFDPQQSPMQVGDFNDDGLSDILVGGNRIILGRTSGFANIAGDASGVADKIVSVPQTYRTSIGVGDFDNDGFDDMIGRDDFGGSLPSNVFLVYGRTGISAAITTPDLTLKSGPISHSFPGFVGDLNADGFSDGLVISAQYREDEITPVTTGTIIYGRRRGAGTGSAPADSIVKFPEDVLFSMNAKLGDVDGDGVDDLGIGILQYQSENGEGRFFVFSGARVQNASVAEWRLFE